jgi:TolB-like protein
VQAEIPPRFNDNVGRRGASSGLTGPYIKDTHVGQRASGMDSLGPAERATANAPAAQDSFAEETIRALGRILASTHFKLVREHARRFLDFVVRMKLLNRQDEIKETTIAIHAFGEPADYDPAISGKIRVAAGSLRQKLAEYYSGEGHNDPILILIPKGTYVPEIRDRRVWVVICAFENWNPKGDQAYLCDAATDELVHQLAQGDLIQATRIASLNVDAARVRYGLRGSFECREDLFRLNVSLSDLQASRILCWRSFEGRREELLKVVRQVSESVVARLSSAGAT